MIERRSVAPLVCNDCDGRGWNVGDCHPREECAKCAGTGDLLSGKALAAMVKDFATARPKYEQNAVEAREMAREILRLRSSLVRIVSFIRNDQCDTEAMRGTATPEIPCWCCHDYLKEANVAARLAGLTEEDLNVD